MLLLDASLLEGRMAPGVHDATSPLEDQSLSSLDNRRLESYELKAADVEALKGDVIVAWRTLRIAHAHLRGSTTKHALKRGLHSDRNRVQPTMTIFCSQFETLFRLSQRACLVHHVNMQCCSLTRLNWKVGWLLGCMTSLAHLRIKAWLERRLFESYELKAADVEAMKGDVIIAWRMLRIAHAHLRGSTTKHALKRGLLSDRNRVQPTMTICCSQFETLSRLSQRPCLVHHVNMQCCSLTRLNWKVGWLLGCMTSLAHLRIKAWQKSCLFESYGLRAADVEALKGDVIVAWRMLRIAHAHLLGSTTKHALERGLHSDRNRVQLTMTSRCSQFETLSRLSRWACPVHHVNVQCCSLTHFD